MIQDDFVRTLHEQALELKETALAEYFATHAEEIADLVKRNPYEGETAERGDNPFQYTLR